MERHESEIKMANRKAIPKFLLMMLVCALLGGVLGFCFVWFGVDEMAGSLKNMGAQFGSKIAPWLLLALAAAIPAVCVPLYRGAKRLIDGWDGEEEAVAEQAEEKLSRIIWISGGGYIVSFFLIAAVYAGGFTELFETGLGFGVAIAAFLAVLGECIGLQRRCVDEAKRINPEKKGSVYDMHFHKKWMNSCDEAEKAIIGQSAYKAYYATTMACTLLAVALTLGALILDSGFLPVLAVCIVWMVNHTVYCLEEMKLSKAGAIRQ